MGGQADGERGRCRASLHLQGQAGTEAPMVGRPGNTLAKGRDTEAGHWVPGLPVLQWVSQGPGQGMRRGQAITAHSFREAHTHEQTHLWPSGGTSPILPQLHFPAVPTWGFGS